MYGFLHGKKLENTAVHVLYITRSLHAARVINIQCAVGADAFRNAVCDGAFALSRNNLGGKIPVCVLLQTRNAAGKLDLNERIWLCRLLPPPVTRSAECAPHIQCSKVNSMHMQRCAKRGIQF